MSDTDRLRHLIIVGSNGVAAALEQAHKDGQDAAYDKLFDALRLLGQARRAVRELERGAVA